MPSFIDLTGQKFGRLLVLKRVATQKAHVRWECRCDCGKIAETSGMMLKSGKTSSCGCLRKQVSADSLRTHGKYKSLAYGAWINMKRRCTNPSFNKWERYGGRGIKVCERWLHSFENFLADMGEKPSRRHTLDRFPNPEGNYEPGNCRWATWSEQNKNKKKAM